MYIGEKQLEKWGIVTGFVIGAPRVRTKKYDVPGRMGNIDATEALTGYPVYDNRDIRIELHISAKSPEEYQELYDEIYKYCHGKIKTITFPFDSDFCYEGRLDVSVSQTDKSHGNVSITADCYPYALKKRVTAVNISSKSAESRVIQLNNAGMPTKLTIETDAPITVTRGKKTVVYSAGKTTMHAPLLIESEEITVSGAAEATIYYQEGKI